MTGMKWSRRTTDKIANLLGAYGFTVSPNTVARLLHAMKFSLRVNQKTLTTSGSADRNLQFDYIADLRVWWTPLFGPKNSMLKVDRCLLKMG
jgi:hypothetical protein